MHFSQVDGTEEAVVNSLTHMIIVAPEDLGPFVICFWPAMILSTLSLRPEPRKKLVILDSLIVWKHMNYTSPPGTWSSHV